ncbi:MAG: glycosyltransferase [Terracidiphilus sp.]
MRLDGAQIWSLMRRSNAGLDPLPNRYDFLATINNKAVEYLSAGLPVISSPRKGVLCDLLKEGACGLSYSSGSVEELIELIERLLSDRSALASMSARAQEVFAHHFMASAAHERMTEYLTEVVSSTVLQRAASPKVT